MSAPATVAVKEHPIQFSTPMVLAILAGIKTQTRRIIRPQPAHSCRYEINGALTHALHLAGHGKDMLFVPPTPTSRDHRLPSPYGGPGDRLWVKERWGYRGSTRSSNEPEVQDLHIEYAADGTKRSIRRKHDDRRGIPLQVCRCSGKGDAFDRHTEHQEELLRYWKSWRPSMFMSRWASRLTLEVTELRVQRLQEISEEDARAEGITVPDSSGNTLSDWFAYAWDVRNVKRAPWSSNPWVWVINFRMVA